MSERDKMTARHMAYLQELADMGMDMARATARQAQENPDKAEELNRVVDRLTRSAMASDRLRRKLAKDLDKRHATARCQVAAQPPTAYVAPPTSRLVH